MTDLPKKAVVRTARLASLPIGYAGRATLGVGKRLRGTPAETVTAQVQQRTAEQLFKVLGELKGGAMKFGQALSVFEAALPEGLVAPYRATLTKLQDAAPPMSSTMVHQVLARELGRGLAAPVRAASTTTRRQPPRSARSTGRAGTTGARSPSRSSTPAPGEALTSDLRQISRVAKLVGVWIPGIDVGPLVAELQARVAEELDYSLEAEAQQTFADAFRGDPDIAVPDVVAHTDRVLVSEWLESERSLARLIADGEPGRPRPVRRALRPVPVLGAGPRRAAARRPAPGQLPGACRTAGSASSTTARSPGLPAAAAPGDRHA